MIHPGDGKEKRQQEALEQSQAVSMLIMARLKPEIAAVIFVAIGIFMFCFLFFIPTNARLTGRF